MVKLFKSRGKRAEAKNKRNEQLPYGEKERIMNEKQELIREFNNKLREVEKYVDDNADKFIGVIYPTRNRRDAIRALMARHERDYWDNLHALGGCHESARAARF